MDWLERDLSDFPTFLVRVRAKPGLWIGARSIVRLQAFLMGMSLAEDYHRVPDADRFGEADLAALEAWVARRHNRRGLPGKSFGLAVEVAGSDAAGFDLWFEWFDTFIAERG